MPVVVVDTDVIVAAMLGRGGAARSVIRHCLAGAYQPLMGVKLFLEYEDLLNRHELWHKSPLRHAERREVIAGFMASSRWTEIYFSWRPNLRDEDDNHLVELAVAGGADAIVTRNTRDFADPQLRFPGIKIVTPVRCLAEFPCPR